MLSQDYSLRARDHNVKKARLKALQAKARDRNPDEFSFRMLSTTLSSKSGTQSISRGNESLSADTVRLLKTQDIGYLRTALGKVAAERKRAEESYMIGSIHGGEESPLRIAGVERKRGNKTIFVNDQDAQKQFNGGLLGFDTTKQEDSQNNQALHGDFDDNNATTAHRHALRSAKLETRRRAEEAALLKKARKSQTSRGTRVEAMKERENALKLAEKEVEMQRLGMGKKRQGIGMNKWGTKFRFRERRN